MKITKYPQSCLLVETNNTKILVDPGNLKYQEKFLNEWKQTDIVLITHKHKDHINDEIINNINVPFYSTKEVKDTYPKINFRIIKENDIININNIRIEVVKAIHGYNPLLKNGGEVFENVGYIIDDKQRRLYITSDTICFNNNYKADIVALPITAHGLTMSSFEAALFTQKLEANIVLPTHMDSEKYPTDINNMEKNFKKFNINYKVLEIEESTED